MPALNISNIKDAKFGSTPLSAVYMGSTNIWQATPDPVLTLTGSRWQRNGSGGCTRGNRYEVYIQGIHNIEDPGRAYAAQYKNDYLQWIGDENYYLADVFTWPNVPFDLRTQLYVCQSNTSGSPSCRMRYKLSDGTITEWSYLYSTYKEESEIEDG